MENSLDICNVQVSYLIHLCRTQNLILFELKFKLYLIIICRLKLFQKSEKNEKKIPNLLTRLIYLLFSTRVYI